MNYKAYQLYCEDVLDNKDSKPPYNNPMYLHYAKLNVARMKRWWNNLKLSADLTEQIKRISSPQKWIIIVEPWCGDAAPAVPIISRLAEINSLVTYEIQLRDQEPFLINHYLTNGAKSIPKLIVKDVIGNDLFTWGPRPFSAQVLVDELKGIDADHETTAIALQNWYNGNKGFQMQQELLALFIQVDKRIDTVKTAD